MDGVNRRRFLATGAAFCMAATLPGVAYARQLDIGGNCRLTIFSDGQMRLPVSMLFSSAPQDKLQSVLNIENQPDAQLARPLNVVLLEDGERTILFDAGSGTNFLSGLGELPAALEAADIAFDDITDIVFTHAHPDHIWGIMDDFDDLLMGNARYHISAKEWDFWDSDAAMAAMPQGRENFAVGAKARFDLIRDEVQLFDFGAEILSGIEVVDSAGHTPGHACFVIHGGDTPVMILGDALTHPRISFEHADWQNDSDMNAEAAVKTRLNLLDRTASEQMLITGYHLPDDALGRVEKHGNGYRYIHSES